MPKCEKCGCTENIYDYLVADDHMTLCPSCAIKIKKAGIDVILHGEATEDIPRQQEEGKNENQDGKGSKKIIGLLVSFAALFLIIIIIPTIMGEREKDPCTICENAPYSSYVWDTVSNTAPTCMQAGITTLKCYRCGRIVEIPSDIGEHDFKTISDTSTCTTDGEKTLQCSICNYQIIENSPAAHSWEYQYKDATCVKNGFEYYSCTICSETKTIPLTKSNSYCNLEYEGAVFDKADKYKKYKCSVCGRVELEKVSFGYEISTSNEYFFYCTTAAKNHVSQHLKYPSSSSFQSDGSMKVYKSLDEYTCVGYVDAANAFGVKERKYFAVTMTISLRGSQFSYTVKDFEIY